uniref:Uncharacterized protein n=1 Tax=Strongyloides stercoralis TaxID=6248 RepID=A0A0K0E069_STRER
MHWYSVLKFLINLEEITMKHFNYKLITRHISRVEGNLAQSILCFYGIVNFVLLYTILKALYEDRTKFINLLITSIIRNHL